ncbi:hypothetical protein LTR95_004892 [Oleoguttula sp. CCFEE 5521]
MARKACVADKDSLAVTKSPFFTKLPGELRNHIWRLAVIADHAVPVSNTGVTEPGLLSTCHMIRKEAGCIYYAENDFDLLCDHYDPTAFMLIISKWERFNAVDRLYEGTGLHISVSHIPSWTNLMIWLKRVHARLLPAPIASETTLSDATPPSRSELFVLQGMFQMAEGMCTMPWGQVEDQLKWQRLTLIDLDEGWDDRLVGKA